MDMALTHLSLFSGIGGIDLAAEWAGFETVGQVEWADYPTKVLEKHWPNVPRWRDIRDVKGTDFPSGITVVSGGFPCQPFSTAGSQKGKKDDRYLWPEMRRVIREVRPTWVVGENVKGIISIALDTVCEELESEGYSVQTFCIPAISVGALHKRERVFIVAHATSKGLSEWGQSELTKSVAETGAGLVTELERCSSSLADSASIGSQGQREFIQPVHTTTIGTGETVEPEHGRISDQWAVEPNVGRVANGVPNRVDRLKSLGNAVVPQQIYPIFKAIADIESGCFA